MNSKIIIKGIKWAIIEFAFGALFRFLLKLVLVKLLLPDDFGLVGMTSIFVSVASATSELGMGAALIQKKDNQIAEQLYNTAFWSGIIWGSVLYFLLCFVASPLIAEFYNEPLLIKLIPVLSIGILLKPLNLIHTVILTRAMNFKTLAMIQNVAAFIAGLIGLLAAFLGFGVWSLVISIFLSSVISIPLLFYVTSWKPKLEWSKAHFNEIFGFGIYSTGTAIFSTITYNIDNLMIGKILGAGALGAYTLAFSLTEMLRQTISSVLNKVMFPVFGQLQDKKEKLKNYFLKIINVNAIVIYPLMFYFIYFGEVLVLEIFGERWTDAILPLKILSFAVMIHLIINSFTSLLRGLGYPGLEFKIILGITLLVLIPGIYIGISNWGLVGASFAILVNKTCLVIVAIIVLKKHIKITLIEIILSVKGAILSSGISFILTNVMSLFKPVNHWVLLSIIYFSCYLVAILYFEKETMKQLKVNLQKSI